MSNHSPNKVCAILTLSDYIAFLPLSIALTALILLKTLKSISPVTYNSLDHENIKTAVNMGNSKFKWKK